MHIFKITVRNCKRKSVTKYSDEDLRKAVSVIKTGRMSKKKALRLFCVPYGTLCNRVNGFHSKTHRGQSSLSANLEEHLRALDALTDWKVPFDGL